MTQPDLFDHIETGKIAKERSLIRVERHADEKWKEVVMGMIKIAALKHFHITTDHVWSHLEHHKEKTHEPRALGALMRRAAVEGMIKPTNIHIPSERLACHSRPIRVWESLIKNQL